MSTAIYIHIPFCIRKCNYCDFYSVAFSPALKKRYLRALLKEIDRAPAAGEIDTVYIGGGTPSLLDPTEVETIMSRIARRFHLSRDAEVSLEVNPGTVDLHKIKALRVAGVNRLSIGVQSMSPVELRLLGRIHEAADSHRALDWASRCFDNFSVDILYGIPGQTPSEAEEGLRQVLRYGPQHVSAYELTVEEGTPFFDMISEGSIALPDDDDKIAMYERIAETLEETGYRHYEISNYAREGYRCRHNMNYWLRGEYLGFGASAHAHIRDVRLRNAADISDYIRMTEQVGSAVVEETPLTSSDRAHEEMFLRLRTDVGLNLDRLSTARELVRRLEREGLISETGGAVRLTEKGMLLSNRVIVELMDALERKSADHDRGHTQP